MSQTWESTAAVLERLRTFNASGQFNLFIGAGISRDPPTNAPIWNEMQVGFLAAVFDRMESADWSIASHFPEDRIACSALEIRPEIFWREMIECCGLPVVRRVLEAANVGFPNRNHEIIATLLRETRCNFAVTTNFDEHLESLLPAGFRIELASASPESKPSDGPAYIKLHGTLANEYSLSFTLEQYDCLAGRNLKLLSLLSGKPLIIAGYSGYDTDVLPGLRTILPSIPFVVILKHPGSRSDQPVFSLAAIGSTAYILEATCQEVLSFLAAGLKEIPYATDRPAQNEDRSSKYRTACEATPLWNCPLILVKAFHLGGNCQLVHRYAWVTHDACCDDLERSRIPSETFRAVHLILAYILKVVGDAAGSRIMVGKAKASLEETGGSFSESVKILEVEALIDGMPSNAYDSMQERPKSQVPFPASAMLSAHESMRRMFLGAEGDKQEVFIAQWQLGLANRREGNLPAAIKAFEVGAKMLTEGASNYLERGRFLLDYGGALYEWAMQNKSAEFREMANTAYQLSEQITREIRDWVTNARAHLMLAKIFLSAGQIDRARNEIKVALESVAKTNDSSLRHRIEEFNRGLDENTTEE